MSVTTLNQHAGRIPVLLVIHAITALLSFNNNAHGQEPTKAERLEAIKRAKMEATPRGQAALQKKRQEERKKVLDGQKKWLETVVTKSIVKQEARNEYVPAVTGTRGASFDKIYQTVEYTRKDGGKWPKVDNTLDSRGQISVTNDGKVLRIVAEAAIVEWYEEKWSQGIFQKPDLGGRVVGTKEQVEAVKVISAPAAAVTGDADETKIRQALVGSWRVAIGKGEGPIYRGEWTFKDNGTVTSTNGAPLGKWTVEKDKKRVYIDWGGPKQAWETFNLPVSPDRTVGESWSNRPVEAIKSVPAGSP